MRGPLTTASGNQDRRDPPYKGKRGRKAKGKGKRKGKGKAKPPAAARGPLLDAMVDAAR